MKTKYDELLESHLRNTGQTLPHQYTQESLPQVPLTGRGSRGGGRAGRSMRGGRMGSYRPAGGDPVHNAEYTRQVQKKLQIEALQRSQQMFQRQRANQPITLPLLPTIPMKGQQFSVDPFRLYAKVRGHHCDAPRTDPMLKPSVQNPFPCLPI